MAEDGTKKNFSDEKRPLDRFDLDKISEERPILFIRVCGHKAAVNTKALETIMALPQTKDYISQIDQEKGILTEASVKLCYDVMQEPSVEKDKRDDTIRSKGYKRSWHNWSGN